MRQALTAVMVLCGTLCLAGELLGQRWLVYLGKPLATAAILALALSGPSPVSVRYQGLIAAGLALSLAGDVLLMLPGDRFVPGLSAFLAAHLCYIAAFAGEGGGLRGPVAAVALGLVGAGMLAVLWPGLGAVRVPVIVYVAVISVMAWQAVARWQQHGAWGPAFAAAGALVFMTSDGALAVRRFVSDFPGSQALILGTYWLAQFLIARSVLL